MSKSLGFTLIEVTVALVVLAIAALGALSAIMASSKTLKEGQLRQFAVALAEAHGQKWTLADKGLVASKAVSWPGTSPDQLPLSDTTTWKLDPTTPLQVTSSPPTYQDAVGVGAFFKVDTLGSIAPVWPVPSYSTSDTCQTVSVPVGTFCRQVAVVKGLPSGAAPPSGTAYTVWTRVWRVGQSAGSAVTHREVIVQ